jgi:hypothetical protein
MGPYADLVASRRAAGRERAWPLLQGRAPDDLVPGALADQTCYDEGANAREVAVRPGQVGDEASRDRSPPPMKTIGIVEVASFAARAAARLPLAAITSTLRPTSGGQCEQTIIVTLCPAVIDRQVLSLGIA